MGIFSASQPAYAEQGIATFPVNDNKIPAIKGYQKIGLPASAKLAQRFIAADGFGYMVGARSKITVGDVDSTDERVLSHFLTRHGSTPLIARTASGKFHALYRHGGEARKIRPWQGLRVDILGGGFVVAPDSLFAKGQYVFIQGSLDDELPVMRGLPPEMYANWAAPKAAELRGEPDLSIAPEEETYSAPVAEGVRNDTLWRYLMQQLAATDFATMDAVVDMARAMNATYSRPLPDEEVIKAASSAWKYHQEGQNRFGKHGSWLEKDVVHNMMSDPHCLALISWLQAQNGPRATFLIANSLAKMFGWSLPQLQKARRRAIEAGWLVPLTLPARTKRSRTGGGPAYRARTWNSPG